MKKWKNTGYRNKHGQWSYITLASGLCNAGFYIITWGVQNDLHPAFL